MAMRDGTRLWWLSSNGLVGGLWVRLGGVWGSNDLWGMVLLFYSRGREGLICPAGSRG